MDANQEVKTGQSSLSETPSTDATSRFTVRVNMTTMEMRAYSNDEKNVEIICLFCDDSASCPKFNGDALAIPLCHVPCG